VRLPGLVAHQEVILGGKGQTLSIRHDSYGRDSFIPGIVLATREVMHRRELVVGLDRLMGLRD
jgi:4-hydroxy-tetrahydrodipicolinate reductase